jgi:hypothetical protein
MRIVIVFIYLGLPLWISAQAFITPIADRSQYAQALFDSPEGSPFIGRHPGIVAKNSTIISVYGENSIIPGGNKYLSFSSVFPISPGSIQFIFDYSGAGDFQQLQGGIGYALGLGPSIEIGLRFNYYLMRMVGYGSASTFPIEAGAVFQLFPKLRTSLYVYNAMAAGPKREGLSKLPTVAGFGMGYSVSESVGISIEIIKESGNPVSFQPIIFYQAAEKLFFKGGISTNNSLVFISGGYVSGHIRMDLSTSYMGSLGWATGLGLQLLLAQRKHP